jgi:hypothetical protein
VSPRDFPFQPGDIAACFGTDWISRMIRVATWSPFGPPGLRLGPSHVAMISESEQGPVWVESTTLCQHPCLVRGQPVSGCQAHEPHLRIGDYVNAGGTVEVYRLAPIHQLGREEQLLLRRILFRHFLWDPVGYDVRGAILSGTRAMRWLGLLPGADLHSLFCSELVAALLMRLGRLNHANPTGYSPARLLRELVHLGKYQRVATWNATPTFWPPSPPGRGAGGEGA